MFILEFVGGEGNIVILSLFQVYKGEAIPI